MSELVRDLLVAVTPRHESLLEVNFGSLQKGEQLQVTGTKVGVGETLTDLIDTMEPGEALIVWRRVS